MHSFLWKLSELHLRNAQELAVQLFELLVAAVGDVSLSRKDYMHFVFLGGRYRVGGGEKRVTGNQMGVGNGDFERDGRHNLYIQRAITLFCRRYVTKA
jgi:hypothetical protein